MQAITSGAYACLDGTLIIAMGTPLAMDNTVVCCIWDEHLLNTHPTVGTVTLSVLWYPSILDKMTPLLLSTQCVVLCSTQLSLCWQPWSSCSFWC